MGISKIVRGAGVAALFLSLTVTARGAGLHEKLNGTWTSNTMTVVFDFDAGTYRGAALRERFSKKLTLVEEYANIVVFRSDGTEVVCQFQGDGKIMLTKKGGIPVLLKRNE